jgi:hypothetical protein
VGHTHADVDQMFAIVKTGMKGSPQIHTVSKFINSIPHWFPKLLTRPTPIYLTNAWGFKEWLTPHLAQTITGQSKPHVFHFSCSPDFKITLETSEYHSTADRWHGPYQVCNHSEEQLIGTIIYIFSLIQILQTLPQNFPLSLVPLLYPQPDKVELKQACGYLYGPATLYKSYKKIIKKFTNIADEDVITDPFTWLAVRFPPPISLRTHSHTIIPGQMTVTGSSVALQTGCGIPELNNVIACAGEDQLDFWLGLVIKINRASVKVTWFVKNQDGNYDLDLSGLYASANIPYSAIIHHDVALSPPHCSLRPTMMAELRHRLANHANQ